MTGGQADDQRAPLPAAISARDGLGKYPLRDGVTLRLAQMGALRLEADIESGHWGT